MGVADAGRLGAEVIKVERPGVGDDTRGWGPPFLKDRDGNDTSDAAYYLCTNRNKKSVTADFRTPFGVEAVKRLVKDADVVCENMTVLALHFSHWTDTKLLLGFGTSMLSLFITITAPACGSCGLPSSSFSGTSCRYSAV